MQTTEENQGMTAVWAQVPTFHVEGRYVGMANEDTSDFRSIYVSWLDLTRDIVSSN